MRPLLLPAASLGLRPAVARQPLLLPAGRWHNPALLAAPLVPIPVSTEQTSPAGASSAPQVLSRSENWKPQASSCWLGAALVGGPAPRAARHSDPPRDLASFCPTAKCVEEGAKKIKKRLGARRREPEPPCVPPRPPAHRPSLQGRDSAGLVLLVRARRMSVRDVGWAPIWNFFGGNFGGFVVFFFVCFCFFFFLRKR